MWISAPHEQYLFADAAAGVPKCAARTYPSVRGRNAACTSGRKGCSSLQGGRERLLCLEAQVREAILQAHVEAYDSA